MRRAPTAMLALVVLVGAFAVADPSGAQTPPPASLSATPQTVTSPQSVTLSGVLSGAVVGTPVQLHESPYPFTANDSGPTTTTGVGGTFSFRVSPDRDTHYSVYAGGQPASADVDVTVIGRALATTNAITLGRARISVLVYHPADLSWAGARVRWSFAEGAHGRFKSAPATRAQRLSQYVAKLSTVNVLPAGHFRWEACFTAPGVAALADPTTPPGCTGRGYTGSGNLPVGFPGPAAIARAEHYLASRGGHTALAVVDSEGRLSGANLNEQFITGSVVKAMLLVAYLRRLNAMGQHSIDPNSNSILYPMIHVSDNNAATACWSIVGDSGLNALAHAAGMTNFSVPASAPWGAQWGTALLTAADQARFFFEMDSLIPKEFVGYANNLLSTIAAYESWGIPAIARPLGYTVWFKAGWRPSLDIFLVHQIARLSGHHHTFAMAVMTDGDPDMTYGIDTIQGTTSALLK